MARPINPNPPVKVRIVKQKLSNGGYHVLERRVVYNAQKGYYEVLSSKLIGKLLPGHTDLADMVPTDKFYSRNVKKKDVEKVQQVVGELPDPRAQERVIYPLDVALFVIVLAACAGKTTNYSIAEFWKCQRPILEKWIPDFPARDISHDTVRRLIALLGTENAQDLISRFTNPLVVEMSQRVIALDGQAVRAASAQANTGRYALNVLDTDNELCLNQVWINEKENEITRAVEAIELLDLKGAIVTCDALNTQKKLCARVISKGADYCMALKQNHKFLYEETEAWFHSEKVSSAAVYETTDLAHGRIETRVVKVLPSSVLEFSQDTIKEWAGLEEGCVVMTTTTRTDKKGKRLSEDTRYFITSLNFEQTYIAERVMRAIRNHWQIENGLHWRLDVTFNQDRTQCSNADYINGRTRLNKIAYNVLSKLQANEEKDTGKVAPTMPTLMTRMMDVNLLIRSVVDLYRG